MNGKSLDQTRREKEESGRGVKPSGITRPTSMPGREEEQLTPGESESTNVDWTCPRA